MTFAFLWTVSSLKKKKTKQILFPMSSLTFLLEETSYALSNPELTGCLACVAVTEWDT